MTRISNDSKDSSIDSPRTKPSCEVKKIALVVFAILSTFAFIFGLLGILAHHGKVAATLSDFFKRAAKQCHSELLAFSVAFISTGGAGMFATLCIVSHKKAAIPTGPTNEVTPLTGLEESGIGNSLDSSSLLNISATSTKDDV